MGLEKGGERIRKRPSRGEGITKKEVETRKKERNIIMQDCEKGGPRAREIMQSSRFPVHTQGEQQSLATQTRLCVVCVVVLVVRAKCKSRSSQSSGSLSLSPLSVGGQQRKLSDTLPTILGTPKIRPMPPRLQESVSHGGSNSLPGGAKHQNALSETHTYGLRTHAFGHEKGLIKYLEAKAEREGGGSEATAIIQYFPVRTKAAY